MIQLLSLVDFAKPAIFSEHARDLDSLCRKFATAKPHHVLEHASTSNSSRTIQDIARRVRSLLHGKSGLDPGNRNGICFELEKELGLAVGYARAVISDTHSKHRESWRDWVTKALNKGAGPAHRFCKEQ
eukprot:3546514-Pyramimonas_sp.AAC.1